MCRAAVRDIPISEVKVLRRLRPLGDDLLPLVEEVQAGHFHLPIIVCVLADWPGYLLAEGARRLEAYCRAGKSHIPALVLYGVNPCEVETAEFQRRDYTDYQRLVAADLMLIEARIEALERQRAGRRVSAKCAKGRALAIVGERVGRSARWVEMGLTVLNSDEKDLITLLHKPQNVLGAYRTLTRRLRAAAAPGERPARGDSWKVNHVTWGDCRLILSSIPDNTFHGSLFDPPFGLGKKYRDSTGNEWIEPSTEEEYWAWFEPIYKEVVRTAMPGGVIILWQSQEYLHRTRDWFGRDAHVFASCKTGAATMGDDIHTAWDPIIIVRKPGGPKLRPHRPTNTSDWAVCNIHDIPEIAKVHPYARPRALCQRLLTSFVIEGGLVLDPFAGVGSVPLACKQTGRDFVGIEWNADYVKVANSLLTAAAGEDQARGSE